MKKHADTLVIALLFALSAAIYAVQFTLFHDSRDTLFYLLQDWAFLPIQIAVVTIVVGKVISDREKRDRLTKTRMLAGSFFSDAGSELLELLLRCTENAGELAPLLRAESGWGEREYRAAAAGVRSVALRVRCQPEDFARLKEFLAQRRLPMLVIASNPALLEHEEFTDMLWAVFHLSDEFAVRQRFDCLPEADERHLNADARRALTELLANWLCHMDHIRTEYPYLYTLALRQNPLEQLAGGNA